MSLTTHSLFYYGHTVDETNYSIDFSEGGPELQASIEIGNYTLTEFAEAIETALNDAGSLTYTVTVNRTTRKITIAGSGTFSLLVSSGSRVGVGAWDLMGFTGSDRTSAASYLADSASGSSYSTQFILQSYVASEHFKKGRNAVVNTSASGESELFKFGDDLFFQMNLTYVTNQAMPANAPIRNNASGIANLVSLMDYLITKAPVEFIPDESDAATFFKVILESSPTEKGGFGYELKELYTKGLPGFFETGVLTMRDRTA